MVIEISSSTLKRLANYEAVVEKEFLEAEKLQWRVMTLEVMQAAEKARARARHVSAAVTYARYLFRIQNGKGHTRPIAGEPLYSRTLVELMEELSIERKMVPEAELETAGSNCHPEHGGP